MRKQWLDMKPLGQNLANSSREMTEFGGISPFGLVISPKREYKKKVTLCFGVGVGRA
jgi:hypothetical protein